MSTHERSAQARYLCTVPSGLFDVVFDHVGRAKSSPEERVVQSLQKYLAGRNLHARLPRLESADSIRVRLCRGTPERWVVFVAPRAQKRGVIEPAEPMSGVIYADGCCRAGVMGIGVVSADFGIDLSRRLTRPGTVNVAECLGLIAALHEARRRGISRAEFRTDSQLVVGWVTGESQGRSRTALRYTPVMRKLLDDVAGRLKWVPGKSNLADTASRRLLYPDPPGHDLGFKELAAMKSGSDQYSRIRLPELLARIGEERAAGARAALVEDADVASCLRWVLRGLDLDAAISKVLINQQIGRAAKAKQTKRTAKAKQTRSWHR